jgi:acetoin utilization deacetylase AcuC-like enzyme
MTRVGFCLDPVFAGHDAGSGHPERPERLEAVRAGLEKAGLLPDLRPLPARLARRDELTRVHTPAHVDRLAAAAGRHLRIDPDTAMSPRSHDAALRAAGSVVEAVHRVLDGELDRAFCAVRPPGHHATPERAMGFCLFNNVAVGAAAALARGLRRVAVLDFDVHHGNGTQDAFWRELRVLFVSSHQFPFYPGTGALDEVGEGDGRGFTVNLPMPGGCGDGEYARAWREIVEPIGREHDPELVLVSAGFDAHRDDPLGGMGLTGAGFAALMDACLAVASGSARGRLVAVLEGGYSPEGIAEATAAVVGRMVGQPGAEEETNARPGIERLLAAFRSAHAPHWRSLRP